MYKTVARPQGFLGLPVGVVQEDRPRTAACQLIATFWSLSGILRGLLTVLLEDSMLQFDTFLGKVGQDAPGAGLRLGCQGPDTTARLPKSIRK